MKRKRIAVFLTGGALCLIAALGLTVYNVWDERRAAESADAGVMLLQRSIPVKPESEQPIIPEAQPIMTTIEMDGRDYVGILELPALDLVLPVQGTWSNSLLKHSPCLYQGTLYDGMIIAGHNYRSHFSGLTRLMVGDEIRFTDVDGNVWYYTLTTTEIIAGHDVEAMEEGDWDLTLFTCTYGGQERYTVRCTMQVV